MPNCPAARFNHHPKPRTGNAMCYADITTHADGTATALCYCGWTEQHASADAADAAAAAHQYAAEFDAADH
ncbi:hypothetical protein GCM10009675_40640 [Prauserella alba]|uniref:Uncharacterized protein n=2 Tax=Prauserella TaxID=142577 RepID=A0ABN1VL88_9PSEU